MAGTYLVKLASSANSRLKNGVDTMCVYADDSASAIVTAKAAHADGASDAAWAAATATLAAAGADLEGWRYRIKIGTVVDVTVTAAAAGTVDTIAALMVIALNATTPIANSAYATPNLTISSIADGIGDLAVNAWWYPPLSVASGGTGVMYEDDSISFVGFLGAIVDEGIAAAALTQALVTAETIPNLILGGRLAQT